MLNSKLKTTLIVLIMSQTIINCSGVQEAFDPKRKNSSEEFLIEKKLPLSMPPDFEILPIPQSEKTNDNQEIGEIKILIENQNSKNMQDQNNKNIELENLILEKIKSN